MGKKNIHIDTRILKTEYKNCDLIARYWNGAYRGRVWMGKQVVADYEGDNLDLILEALINIVDQGRQQRLAEFSLLDENEQWLQVWSSIKGKCSKPLIKALELLSQSEGYSLSAGALNNTASFETVGQLLSSFRLLEQRLNDEFMQELQENLGFLSITVPSSDSIGRPKDRDQIISITEVAARTFSNDIETIEQ